MSNVTATHAMRPGVLHPVHRVTIDGLDRWELDALAELIDGCEPEGHEQIELLAALRAAVPVRERMRA
jgi:hypothetical protein